MELSELKNRTSSIDTENSEKQKRKTIILEDIKEKQFVLEKAKNELEVVEKEINEKIKIKEELEIKVKEIEEKRNNLINEKSIRENQLRDYEVDKIKLNSELEDIEKKINSVKIQIVKTVEEKSKTEQEFNGIKSKLSDLIKINKSYIEKKEKLNIELNEIDKNIKQIESEINLENNKLNELNYQENNILAKERSNKNIIENNETFNKGIKYILNKKEEGVLGAFINLIEIPKGYEDAIQTLSGGSFQDIVTINSNVAKQNIEELKNNKIGRASFLPIDSIKTVKIIDNLPNEKGVIGFTRNIVKYDKKIQKVIDFVFANSIVVESLNVGTELMKKGFNDRIVTLDGDIISARGRMTGGHSHKRKDDLIVLKKELLEISEKLETIGNQKNQILLSIKNKNQIKDEQIIKKDKLLSTYSELEKEHSSFNMTYDENQRIYKKIERELETLEYEEKENIEFLKKQTLKIDENKSMIEKIKNDIKKNLELLSKIEIEMLELNKSKVLFDQLNELNVSYGVLKEKHINYKQRYDEIDIDYNKLLKEEKEINMFENNIVTVKDELLKNIENINTNINNKTNENEKLIFKIKENELKTKQYEELEKQLIATVKDVETKIILQQNEHEKLIELTIKVEKDLEYLFTEKDEINELNQNVITNEEYKKIETDQEYQATKRKLSMDEKSRLEIGSVNLASIEEYEKEELRYNNLVDQKRDLLSSSESLFNLIKDIENEIVSKFNHAFIEINKNFEYMCKEILNGARGEIKLSDSENLLETGLELSVKYKNKPEQTLMLLSGGEKSMLAVSFIMAIFMFKPSPFTFFDEIEAALDESNTKKIVKLLNNFIEKSQFILITHNKETMKGSHRLYGVTMNKEIGESRIVSVDV